MTIHSSELRETKRLKAEARNKPVMITEYGAVEFVFMTISDFNEMKSKADKYEQADRRNNKKD